MPKVSVLGAGPWGTTLAWLVARGGRPVQLWSSSGDKRAELRKRGRTSRTEAIQLPDSVHLPDSIEEALASDLVLLALQPAAVRPTLRSFAPVLRPEQGLVHFVKGFEVGGTPISQVITEETRVLRVGAVAGPVVPAELWKGADTAVVIGSPFQALIDEVTEWLTTDQVRVYSTRDLAGVEVGGAMRTPIAIATGVLRARGLGRALTAVLLTRGIAEGARLAEALGGQPRTLAGLSGVGDWMVTTTDPEEPLVQAGLRLAEGDELGWDEADSRVRTLLALGKELGIDLPITRAVCALLDGADADAVLREAMARAPRAEVE
ncbi:MAG: NAD(P)H-dependent glycerol-3-phosphate dehydrogenase [Myxococcota bacterium]|nr:NAD(P)H-dependent glycerol-3-phosphate dehydrogenase [Myxococcota bacterium]